MARVTIHFDDDLSDRLRERARSEGRSLRAVVHELVRGSLEAGGPGAVEGGWAFARVSHPVFCPWCGERSEIFLDPSRLEGSNGAARFREECPACAGEMLVHVQADRGGKFHARARRVPGPPPVAP
jgi:hypothetical protein